MWYSVFRARHRVTIPAPSYYLQPGVTPAHACMLRRVALLNEINLRRVLKMSSKFVISILKAKTNGTVEVNIEPDGHVSQPCQWGKIKKQTHGHLTFSSSTVERKVCNAGTRKLIHGKETETISERLPLIPHTRSTLDKSQIKT